jgi:hypothetical protein
MRSADRQRFMPGTEMALSLHSQDLAAFKTIDPCSARPFDIDDA